MRIEKKQKNSLQKGAPPIEAGMEVVPLFCLLWPSLRLLLARARGHPLK